MYVRKRSLPEESVQRHSHNHHTHRFTEPCIPSINELLSNGDVTLTSGDGGTETAENSDTEVSLYRLSRGRIPQNVEIVSATDDELMNCESPSLASVPSISCSYNNHLESSNSRIDEAVAPSSDNSAGSEITIDSIDSTGQEELSVSEGLVSQSFSDEYDGDSELTESVTSESIASQVEIKSVSAGGSPKTPLEIKEDGVSSDPPALPPRTYKAPPLPPRIRVETPPLPPRLPEKTSHSLKKSDGMEVAKLESDIALEPPPLPPRTYSPIHMQNESGSSLGSQISIGDDNEQTENQAGPQDSSSEQLPGIEAGAVGGKPPEVLPWSSGLKGSKNKHSKEKLSHKHSDGNNAKMKLAGTVSAQLAMLPSIESVVSNVTPKTSPEHMNRGDFMQSSGAKVEGSLDADRHSGEGASGMTQDINANTPSRARTVSKDASASPPIIQPRVKKLSDKEKQQNRQQISQNLKVWTHNKQISGGSPGNKPASDLDSAEDGPAGDSGCDTTNSDQTNSAGSVSSFTQSQQTPSVQAGAANTIGGKISPSNSVVWQLRQPQAAGTNSTGIIVL